ncbi:3-dehydroquinate synthase [Pseudoclostridium thermosuccinogenes]|uniref:3-dehydroquinate synthase n=1 Tax=Clostridium thermosuccinogenes TaxID=84032 RepID=UPI002FDAC63B
MIKMSINLGERSYPIYIATNYADIGKSIASARLTGKMVLITDTNVDMHQADECINALKESGYDVHKYVIAAGEENKNLDTVNEIYRYLVKQKLERNSVLIALGGGVVGDITGFVAATFLRGINFVQVPTTLIAQADSSVGGKVGVDFEGSKNIIGAFYQPRLVYINVNSLKTLPKREVQAGLAEVVKHGIIKDRDFFDYVEYNLNKIFEFKEDVLQFTARANCSIKGSVVEEDEREGGLRAILNFGHTIGHAVESVSGFQLLHGECVSIGMVGAFKMAQHLGMVDAKESDRVIGLLERIGLPTGIKGMDVDKVFAQMYHDKKIKNNKLVFILPKRIGEVLQISIDDTALIKEVLQELAQ